jgi:tetratricopeptide (TPR) repeat protein
MGPAESKVRVTETGASLSRRGWRKTPGEAAQANGLIPNWQLPLDTRPRKVIAISLVVITCGILFYQTWWLFLAAWVTRPNKTDPALYERAIKYHPDNADYHFVLAQIYNYSTQYLDIARAGQEYEAAVRLNPYRASHWLELSKYYEQLKDVERSRNAMKMALERDPNYAQTHWAAANLYIRLDDLPAADLELRRTADLDGSYLTQVLDLAWRFYQDPDRIMVTHVPNRRDTSLIALNYFVTQQSERGAELAWTRLKRFDTAWPERVAYLEYLVSLGKPHEAWQVFLFPETASDSPIFNRSFESEPKNSGFDWRFNSTEHAVARRDTTTAKTGLASWMVVFDGKENVDYHGLAHWIPVTKGRSYNLSFWMKTEMISTNEGIYVEVDNQVSEKQLGTTYWQKFTIPFTASSDLVTLRLRRVPSKKFDNLLKGKVWLDDFELN